MPYRELGGFAENPDVLDGTEETYNAFNFCLAQSYLWAIGDEDFELIGDVTPDLIRDVAQWLNYDGEIGRNNEQTIKKMLNGTLITIKNRTFKEAIIAKKDAKLAYVWLRLDCRNDIDLIVCHILNVNDIEDYDSYYYSDSSIFSCYSREKLIEVLKDIISKIKDIYEKENDENTKKNILSSLKVFLQEFKYSESLGKIYLDDYDKYGFIKENILKRKN